MTFQGSWLVGLSCTIGALAKIMLKKIIIIMRFLKVNPIPPSPIDTDLKLSPWDTDFIKSYN